MDIDKAIAELQRIQDARNRASEAARELEELDEQAYTRVFHNSGRVPKEYPHASDTVNVAKFFWRKALEYERNRLSGSDFDPSPDFIRFI